MMVVATGSVILHSGYVLERQTALSDYLPVFCLTFLLMTPHFAVAVVGGS